MEIDQGLVRATAEQAEWDSKLTKRTVDDVVAAEAISNPYEVDLSKTRFIITAYPDHRWPVETVIWLETIMRGITPARSDYRDSLKKKQIMCARNTAVRHCALNSHKSYEWFVFIDQDVRPTDHTIQFLQLQSDIKCCQVEMYNKHAWSSPTAFHEAIWCTSRKVLEAIKPPWFEFKYNADGTDLVDCICGSFRRKALDAGFSISHGGWAEHDKDSSWCG